MQFLLCLLALTAVGDEPFRAWVPASTDAATLPVTIGKRLSPSELASLATSKPTLPFAELTAGVRTPDGATWVGSRNGLMVLAPGEARWRLFHSQRWLKNDDVQDLAVTAQGDVLAKTPAGISRLVQRQMTLDEKMAGINTLLQKHHVENGIIGSIHLKQPGTLEAGYEQHSNDNDGLWTSLYVAAEAFRYGVTHDPAARTNARRSLEALMFLERITGIPGFAARSVVPIEEDAQRYRGEWHRSADNRWWWKGDTSSDEVDGHYFAYAIYYDTVANDEEKKEISQYVARITDHILDHDLHYVGPSGNPTTWGVWAPEELNHDLRRVGDRGLNSLEILSHLKVAEHIVGKPRYTEKIKELIEKHSYETNTVFRKLGWPLERENHSDDELAFLAYYPLLIYERDPQLRRVYLTSIRRSWTAERPEQSPLFNLIYGAALQASTWTDYSKRPDAGLVNPKEYDRDECIAWFRDVPQDTISWTVKNSERQDVQIAGKNRFGRPRAVAVLPVHERALMRWNGDPYMLDGGSEGHSKDDGTAILLPYWLGRYHRLID